MAGASEEQREIAAVREEYEQKILEILEELERREVEEMIYDIHSNVVAPLQSEIKRRKRGETEQTMKWQYDGTVVVNAGKMKVTLNHTGKKLRRDKSKGGDLSLTLQWRQKLDKKRKSYHTSVPYTNTMVINEDEEEFEEYEDSYGEEEEEEEEEVLEKERDEGDKDNKKEQTNLPEKEEGKKESKKEQTNLPPSSPTSTNAPPSSLPPVSMSSLPSPPSPSLPSSPSPFSGPNSPVAPSRRQTQQKSPYASFDSHSSSSDEESDFQRSAPLWVPDHESDSCQLCNKPFSVFVLRHHCRSCGALVCCNCAKVTVKMDDIKIEGDQRCCKECKDKHYSSQKPISHLKDPCLIL